MDPCRICLIKPEIPVNIFNSYKNKYNLQEIIYDLSQIELHSGDHLPIYICELCSDKLVDCHLFRQKLLESRASLTKVKHADNVMKNKFSMEAGNDDDPDNNADGGIVNGDNVDVGSFQNFSETEGKRFDCDICQECFDDKTEIVMHLSKTHPEFYKSKVYMYPKLENDLTCQWCLGQYSNASNYRRHVRRIHGFEGNFNNLKRKCFEENEIEERRSLKSSKKSNDCDPSEPNAVDNDAAKILNLNSKSKTYLADFDNEIESAFTVTPDMLRTDFSIDAENDDHCDDDDDFVDTDALLDFKQTDSSHKIQYECDFCDEFFKDQCDLIEHLSTEHSEIHKSRIYINEKLTLKQFTSTSHYNRHIRKTHGFEGEFPMKSVVKESLGNTENSTTQYGVLQIGRSEINDECKDELDEDFVKELICQWCHRKYSNTYDYDRHIRMLHGFTGKFSIQKTIIDEANHPEQNSQEDQTDATNNPEQNSQEDQTDAKSKYHKIKCKICLKNFKLISTLRTHYRSHHTDLERYSCDYCKILYSSSKKFVQHYHQNHVQISADDLDPRYVDLLRCQWCLIQFSNMSNYARHLRIFHGINNSINLVGTFEPNRSYLSCPVCHKKVSNTLGLYQHLTDFHSMNRDTKN